MVHLASMKCGNCALPVLPDFANPTELRPIGFFSKAHRNRQYRVFCGTCTRIGLGPADTLMTPVRGDALEVLNAVAYLTNVAPDDELKLLNFGKWNPQYCRECSTPYRNLGYKALSCRACVKPVDAAFTFVGPILKELSASFMDIRYKAEKRVDLLSIYSFLPCSKCREAATQFTERGLLYCKLCLRASSRAFPLEAKMMWSLSQFVRCVPDVNDLSLLTYSKWTPFRCSACADPYSNEENKQPLFHSTCKKFRCRDCFHTDGCCARKAAKKPIDLPFIITAVDKLKEYFGGEEEVSLGRFSNCLYFWSDLDCLTVVFFGSCGDMYVFIFRRLGARGGGCGGGAQCHQAEDRRGWRCGTGH